MRNVTTNLQLNLIITIREGVKKTDYLVTSIKFPLTPNHLPPRMTYDKNEKCCKANNPPTLEK